MIKKFNKLVTSGTKPPVSSSPVVVALADYIYFFGGIKDNFATKVNTPYNDLYRLDGRTHQWEKLSPSGVLPLPRAYSAAVADSHNNQMIIFGGADYSGDFKKMVMYNDLWTYSPNENVWKELPATKRPGIRSKPSGWFVNNKFYLFAGVDPTWKVLNDLWVYDLTTYEWTELIPNGAPGSPSGRHEALSGTTATSAQKLVIYGGEGVYMKDINRFPTLNDTWEYDIATNQWQEITPIVEKNILPPRNFATAVMCGDRLLVQGGAMDGVGAVPVAECGAPFPQRGISDELWEFDCSKRVWTKLGIDGDGLPRLKRNSATLLNNKMYIFSGWDYQWYGDGPGQLWNEQVYCFDTELFYGTKA